MNSSLNHAAKCFELFEGDTPVAFLGVLHQPTRQRLPLKRVTRLVVLPDYQGIGIGRAFLDAIADLYMQEGFMFEIKTSARNLISSLRNDPALRTASYGFSKASEHQKQKNWKSRNEVKTATFVKRDASFSGNSVGGGWCLHDYSTDLTAKKRILTFGKGAQSTIRSDCKVATFRSVINDG